MPEQLDTLLKQVSKYERQGNYSKLAEIYREIAKYYYKIKDKAKDKEYLQKSKEAKAKAKEFYEKAIELKPELAEPYRNLAFLLAEHFNDYKLAQEYYTKGLELKSEFKDPNFISEINIKKVRHLEGIDIQLSDIESRHLVLTGKNGSGKTSVLDECRNYLKGILEMETEVLFSKTFLKEFLHPTNYSLKFTIKKDIKDLRFKYDTGNFIVVHFPATRTYKPKPVSPLNIVSISKINKVDILISEGQLLGYMTSDILKRSIEVDEGKTDAEAKEKYNKFKNALQKGLQIIFEDPELTFRLKQYSVDSFTAEIKTKDREPFLLDQLADGYASIFYIYSELILRMSHFKTDYFDMEGIVLIDEPEDHLHLDMQKKMLPFLTKMFPKLQFIVATHSPFILTSLPNAVIYDLEENTYIDKDMSAYPYSSIVEDYFDVDEFSEAIKNNI